MPRRLALSRRIRTLLAIVASLAVVLPLGWMWNSSLLPESYDLAEMGYVDHGGGPRTGGSGHHGHADHGGGTAVADLVADPSRRADVRETLTVRRENDRITVNGTSPGPELRAREGDLVEVTLVNDNIEDGATLHWHGVDVPNAADGVAGVTQDAVAAGKSFTYRFVADAPGTYWYHSHQISHEQVRQGLLGALVIVPRAGSRDGQVLDRTAVLHTYGSRSTLNGSTEVETVDAVPGQRVRLRAVNSDNGLTSAWVTGAPFQVLAVDGTDLNEPSDLTDRAVQISAGGRVDLGFTVPEGGVRVDFGGTNAIAFGSEPPASPAPEEFVDLLGYGSPAEIGFETDDPDRRFDYRIGRRLGFLDGKPGRWWTINGHMFPEVPMFMVDEGDVVVFEIDNDSGEAHPMHLHGHHAVVLSRNGEPSTGSPWWVDSLEVAPGDRFQIAFLADNPGLWMDHCHNLPHAAEGLVAHLMYSGVTSSFMIGGRARNEPE